MADCGPAQCLHVHLRDAHGAGVAVQLFHSRLRDFCGQISHLVGIREDIDGERPRPLPDTHIGEDVHFETWRESAVEDRSSSGSVMTLRSASSDSPGIGFAVDAKSPCLTLLSYTPSVTALIGQHGDVLHWVARDVTQSVLTLIQETTVGAPRGIEVNFKQPHSQFAGNFRARCEVHLFVADSDDKRVRVWVTLSDLKFSRRRRAPTTNTGTRRGRIQHLSL